MVRNRENLNILAETEHGVRSILRERWLDI